MEKNHFLVYLVDLGEVFEIENSNDVCTLDQRFGQVPSAAVVAKIFGTPKELSAGQKMVIESWISDNNKPEDVIVVDVVAVEPTVELRIVLDETTLPLVLLKKELEDQKRDARAGTVLLAENGALAMFVLNKEKAAELNVSAVLLLIPANCIYLEYYLMKLMLIRGAVLFFDARSIVFSYSTIVSSSNFSDTPVEVFCVVRYYFRSFSDNVDMTLCVLFYRSCKRRFKSWRQKRQFLPQ